MDRAEVLDKSCVDTELLTSTLVQQVSCIPEVEGIFLLEGDAALGVWTVINIPDWEVRQRIYEREAMLIDSFPDIVWDFHVVTRRNRELDFIAPSGGRLVFSR